MGTPIRIADYIAGFLSDKGITDVFSVTGGGAMHLNDGLGKHPGLHCVYNHHEQACAMAAESYARLTGRIAAVCVTTGPGGTNAITGVIGGWLDSIPMLILSGQVRYDTTAHSTGKPMRQVGDQEFGIIGSVGNMTKYAVMVIDPLSIRYHLERALYLATHGRQGPCWLDIPLNVQAAPVDPDLLTGYDPAEDAGELPPKVGSETAAKVLDLIRKARRPVLMAGSGIRLSGGHDDFISLIDRMRIPVVTPWNSHDNIWDDHPMFFGRPGNMGERVGNFVVQNSDLLISIGCRLSIRQVSYNWDSFAREAYKIMVDIDPLELEKPTLRIDLPIHADAGDFIRSLSDALAGDSIEAPADWLDWCRTVKARYPVVLPEYWCQETPLNPYCFFDAMFRKLQQDQVIISANGSCCVMAFQMAYLQKGQRLYHNSGCASMGYGLPAAIGAAFGRRGERIICLEGDGSIQMNLQELQTIVHHHLPITIFMINNSGYHSIRQTQTNYFGQPLVGVGPGSGLSFPDMQKIAWAYGIPSNRITALSELQPRLDEALSHTDGPFFCEVVVDPAQVFSPKLSSRKLPDGRMVSAPLEDMAPFLPREEFRSVMLIPTLDND